MRPEVLATLDTLYLLVPWVAFGVLLMWLALDWEG